DGGHRGIPRSPQATRGRGVGAPLRKSGPRARGRAGRQVHGPAEGAAGAPGLHEVHAGDQVRQPAQGVDGPESGGHAGHRREAVRPRPRAHRVQGERRGAVAVHRSRQQRADHPGGAGSAGGQAAGRAEEDHRVARRARREAQAFGPRCDREIWLKLAGSVDQVEVEGGDDLRLRSHATARWQQQRPHPQGGVHRGPPEHGLLRASRPHLRHDCRTGGQLPEARGFRILGSLAPAPVPLRRSRQRRGRGAQGVAEARPQEPVRGLDQGSGPRQDHAGMLARVPRLLHQSGAGQEEPCRAGRRGPAHVAAIWRAMDDDCSGWIAMRELDPDVFEAVATVKRWGMSVGGVSRGLRELALREMAEEASEELGVRFARPGEGLAGAGNPLQRHKGREDVQAALPGGDIVQVRRDQKGSTCLTSFSRPWSTGTTSSQTQTSCSWTNGTDLELEELEIAMSRMRPTDRRRSSGRRNPAQALGKAA
ncbi:unnamed protein product, partial [Prorocentrum cordatum]